MMYIPTSLAVTQWVLLFGLAILVTIVYRQLGHLLRLQSVGSARDGLQVGDRAAGFEFRSFAMPNKVERFDPISKWSLLVFADPGCSSCEKAIEVLSKVDMRGVANLRIAVATSLEPAGMPLSSLFRSTSIPVLQVDPDVPTKLYRSNSVPLAILIDPSGVVRAKAIPIHPDRIAELLRHVGGETLVSNQELEVVK